MVTKRFISKRLFPILLSAAILVAALPAGTLAFAADNYAATFYIDQGDVMINGNDATGYDINGNKFSAKIEIGGLGNVGFCVTQTDQNIPATNAVLLAGLARVTLKSVNIDMPKKQAEDAPMIVYDGAYAIVKIDHEVTLNGCHDEGHGTGTAGLQVNATASVFISSANDDDSIDILNVSGGRGSAGIGGGINSGYVQADGNRSLDAGSITINSGSIKPDAYNFETLGGAGIGGGRLGSAKSINLLGGRVIAYGGPGASGIGQGAGTASLDKDHVSDKIEINGAYVKAYAGSMDQADIGSTTIPTNNVIVKCGTVYATRSGYIGTSTGNNYISGGSFINVKSVIGKSPVSTNVGNQIVYPAKLKFPDSYDDSALTGILVYMDGDLFPYTGYNMHTDENNELTVYLPEGSCNSQFTIRGTLYTYTGTVTSSQSNVLKVDSPLTISELSNQYSYGESVPIPSVSGGCPTGTLTYSYIGREGTSYSSATAPTKIGKYTYKAAKSGDESYHDQTASYDFEIVTNTNLLAVDPIPDQMYTGNPFTPEVTVRLGGKTLVKDTDYTLQYNKANTAISTYALSVIGINDYDGYTSGTQYKVIPRKITLLLSGVSSDYAYTGSEIKPVATVRDDMGNILQPGQNYGIVYSSNMNAGKATVEAYGKNNYLGSSGQTTFNIKPDATPFTVSNVEDVEYDGTPHVPTVTVKSGEKVLQLNTDYNLKYANLTNAGTATIEVTGKGNYLGNAATVTFTIKPRKTVLAVDVADQFYTGGAVNAPINVKDGAYGIATKNYLVTYINNINVGTATITVAGVGNYLGSSGNATFKIKPISGTLTIDSIPDQKYTGSTIMPAVTVKYGNQVLLKDIDFDVSYVNNVSAGSAVAKVTGKGNYEGSTGSINFNIVNTENIFSIDKIANQKFIGSAITPDVIVKVNKKTLVKDTDYTVFYANNVNAGTAMVTVTGKGSYNGYTGYSGFYIIPKATALAVDSVANQMYTGSAITPAVTVRDGEKMLVKDTDYTVSYTNNVNLGTATVAMAGKRNYAGCTVSTSFKIVGTLNTFSVDNIADQTYTGSAITPDIIVKAGEKTLAKDTDYSISYSNNVNIGTATVVVTGKGDYAGYRGGTSFYIIPKAVTLTIDPITNQMYTGSVVMPAVTVKDGGHTLLKDTEYEISYSNNVREGTATANVTGKGNYLGSNGTTQFTIVKMPNTFSIENIVDQTYTGREITPGVIVKDSGKMLVKDTDYSVSYSNNINVGMATVVVTGKGAYVGYNGSTSFYIVSKAVTLTIDPITDQMYTGSVITPNVIVKDGDKMLVKDTDYTVSYNNNINVGVASVIVTGKGAYAEYSASTSFNILNIAKAFSVENVADQTYTGAAITPDVIVKDGGKMLVKDTDYTVSYSNNINAGTATVVVAGKGSYGGYVGCSGFYIIPRVITLPIDTITEQIYTGSVVTPAVNVKDGDYTLLKDTDYTISYSDNVNKGTATVKVVGKGNYLGSEGTAQFTIVKKANTFAIENIADYTYTGSAITPDIIVKDSGKTLVKDTDYTVSYVNNINAGAASAIVTGKGAYAGYNGSTSFYIVSRKITFIIENIANQVYTGSVITPNVIVKDGEKILVKDKDYTVSYSKHVNPGKAAVNVAGKGNYLASFGSANFNIIKQNQTGFTFPTDSLIKKYGNLPFEVSAQGGQGSGVVTYTVTSGNNVVSINGNKITIHKAGIAKITAVKAGDSNYNQAQAALTIQVGKAVPVINTLPSASNLTKGSKLSISKLTGGITNVPGSFQWSDPNLKVTDSGEFSVTFIPTDAENHQQWTGKVSVKVLPSTNSSGTGSTVDPINENTSSNNIPSGGTGSELDSNLNKSSGSEKSNLSGPKTGDTLPVAFVGLLGASLVLIAICKKRK